MPEIQLGTVFLELNMCKRTKKLCTTFLAKTKKKFLSPSSDNKSQKWFSQPQSIHSSQRERERERETEREANFLFGNKLFNHKILMEWKMYFLAQVLSKCFLICVLVGAYIEVESVAAA